VRQTTPIVDSKPELTTVQTRLRIGRFCFNWFKSEMNASKKSITEAGGPLYIADPVKREATMQNINIKLYGINDWQHLPVTFWHQGEQNEWDCGILMMRAMFYFASHQRNQLQTPELSEEKVKQMRLVLLKFIYYKYTTKSDEHFDPNILFDFAI
jgi:hypothetical protein